MRERERERERESIAIRSEGLNQKEILNFIIVKAKYWCNELGSTKKYSI